MRPQVIIPPKPHIDQQLAMLRFMKNNNESLANMAEVAYGFYKPSLNSFKMAKQQGLYPADYPYHMDIILQYYREVVRNRQILEWAFDYRSMIGYYLPMLEDPNANKVGLNAWLYMFYDHSNQSF